MHIGIRAKYTSALAAFALALVSIATASHLLLRGLERDLLSLYQDRVVPVRELKSVSDRYAIDVVDAVHKVCAGRLDAEQGAKHIAQARRSSDASWRLLDHNDVFASAGAFDEAIPLRARADAAAARAQRLMAEGRVDELERFRTSSMYPAIEPLTAHLGTMVTDKVAATDLHVQEARSQLEALRSGAITILVAVSMLALGLAVWASRQLVTSLDRIGTALRAVTAGDLEQQVRVKGTDELASIGAAINTMIASLNRSRDALRERSEALARAAKKAEAASVAKSAFLSSMSHELRTPLNVILGYSQLMVRERDRTSEDRRALSRVVSASTHLLRLIEDILSISRIEAGKLELRPRAFSPAALLSSIEDLFAAQAAAKRIDLTTELDRAVPAWVECDDGRLRQILVNLVGNALKFTKRGSVTISVTYEEDRLIGAVADTGPGIPASEQQELFRTFQQGSSGRAAAEGTGLGLYISASLAREMGGRLELDASTPAGTRFVLRIPAPPCAAGSLPTELSRPPRIASECRPGPMLVVDDRETNREVLGRLLQEIGFEVDEAEDGCTAIAMNEAKEYCAVWMDLRMPKMRGEDALRGIRAHEHRAGLAARPIIAITASVLEIDKATARDVGFDGLVGKPFDIDEIVDLIRGVLGMSLVDDPPQDLLPDAPDDYVATLPAETRDRLLDQLLRGDTEAAKLALGEEARSKGGAMLCELIDSFEVDELIESLRAMQSNTTVDVERGG